MSELVFQETSYQSRIPDGKKHPSFSQFARGAAWRSLTLFFRNPRPEGRGSSTPTYTNSSTLFSGNPPAGRPGIFHDNLHQQPHTFSAIPRPEGRGSFTITYTNSRTLFSGNPPAGRPGILHDNLHQLLHTFFRNPRPEGRGFFTITYTNSRTLFPKYPGRKAGDP